jgi:hypothetical protein
VIRANHLGYFAMLGLTYFRTTVATSIMEGAHLPIFASYNRDRVITNLQGEVLAWFFKFEGVTGKDPVFMPNLLQILAVYTFVAIKLPWE